MVITETKYCWRLSSLLVYKEGSTNLFTPYSWSFDNFSRITQQVNEDGTSDYTYDSTSQLTAADHDYQTDEAYSYDANGNRTMTGYSTGTNNRLLNDGTHTYTYDFEGNRTKKTVTATGEATEYEWDHRNRLVRVTHLDSVGDPVQTLDYIYDVLDRRIGKTDTPAVGSGYTERYVYDGEHLAIKFGSSALANRYMHGPVIDHILADEQVSSLSSPGDVLWPLVDNLGKVRDLAEYDSGTGGTVIVNHISYDAFGGITAETNAAVDHLFAYTGREWDAEADLQYNRARWYDPAVGRWLSEDPIGFEAGDANLSRYVGNATVLYTDPSGMTKKNPSPTPFNKPILTVGNGFPTTLPPQNHITLIVGTTGSHMFVVALTTNMQAFYFSSHCDENNVHVATTGPLSNGEQLFPNTQFVVVGDYPDSALAKLQAAVSNINSVAQPYHLVNSNCHSSSRYFQIMAGAQPVTSPFPPPQERNTNSFGVSTGYGNLPSVLQ